MLEKIEEKEMIKIAVASENKMVTEHFAQIGFHPIGAYGCNLDPS